VRGVVVDDDMQIQGLWSVLLISLRKPDILMPVTRPALCVSTLPFAVSQRANSVWSRGVGNRALRLRQ